MAVGTHNPKMSKPQRHKDSFRDDSSSSSRSLPSAVAPPLPSRIKQIPKPQPLGAGRMKRNTTTDTNRTVQSANSRQQKSAGQPAYTQYIRDRVSGVSYVPREHRSTMNEYHDYSDCNDHALHARDPTDCLNRPPHFLCWVPICVRRSPWFCEQNALCERQGKFGFHQCGLKQYHRRRRPIFIIGFTFNLIALGLMVVASMAFSINYNLLSHTSFTRGVATVPQLSNSTEAIINIGFRAIAMNDPISNNGGQDVITLINFCGGDQDDFSKDDVLQDSVCGECQQSSYTFVISCLINMIFIIRNMFSDITRMYPRYDLNCPKCTGSLMATLSFFLGCYTIILYQNRCFKNFDRDIRPDQFFFSQNTTGFDGDENLNHYSEDFVNIQFRWSPGPGFTCLILATFFRMADAICNFIVPTPGITRDKVEQAQYEMDFGDASQFDLNDEEDDDGEDEEYGEGDTHVHHNSARNTSTGTMDSSRRPPRNLTIPTAVEAVRKGTLSELFDRQTPIVPDFGDESLTEEGSLSNLDMAFVVSGDYRHKEEPLTKEASRMLSMLGPLDDSHHSGDGASPLSRMLPKRKIKTHEAPTSSSTLETALVTSSKSMKDNSPYGTSTTASSRSSERFPEEEDMTEDLRFPSHSRSSTPLKNNRSSARLPPVTTSSISTAVFQSEQRQVPRSGRLPPPPPRRGYERQHTGTSAASSTAGDSEHFIDNDDDLAEEIRLQEEHFGLRPPQTWLSRSSSGGPRSPRRVMGGDGLHTEDEGLFPNGEMCEI